MPSFTSADGGALQGVHWPAAQPPGAAPRGTVLLVHGLGEHGGRYAHVAARLNQQGWSVWAYDQRGHGRSAGARGALPTVHSLLADLGGVLAQLRQTGPAGPLVLLGHSLGGLIAARLVAEGLAARPAPWWQAVDALVMSSPALDPGMNAVQRALLAVLGPLAPNLALGNGLNPAWVCSDPAVVRAYAADPLVHDRITPRLVRFIVDAGTQVRAQAAQWRVPTLLLYAGADRCVAPRGSDAFAAAAPPAVVQARRFEGWSHELFNEPQQALALDTLTLWLAARF